VTDGMGFKTLILPPLRRQRHLQERTITEGETVILRGTEKCRQ